MPKATFHFPRGFLWGTATSSHQVEGNNTNNNWWVWEHEPGHILNGDKSGLACDWWGGRWREDFDRAQEGGQNAHRFSIEWSRVQPLPDKWDEDALDHYREMARGLRERNMTSLITLHHFTDPLWLADSGGWESESIVQLFASYATRVVEALQEYNNLWVTINEPNLVAIFGYLLGAWPPGKKSFITLAPVIENILRAHAAAYHAIHQVQKTARVGMAHHYRSALPAKAWFPLDQFARSIQVDFLNEIFPLSLQQGCLRWPLRWKKLLEIKGTQDFLGLNYYTQELVAFNLFKPNYLFTNRYFRPGADLSENQWIANEPDGLYEALSWARKFNLPIIITENGVEDSQGKLGPRYMIQHIHKVWRAVNFNWPVRGYFWWTLVDNFEWERGWSQRYGLWELNVETQTRRKRAAADLYAAICRENGISSEMAEQYAPEIFQNLFPG